MVHIILVDSFVLGRLRATSSAALDRTLNSQLGKVQCGCRIRDLVMKRTRTRVYPSAGYQPAGPTHTWPALGRRGRWVLTRGGQGTSQGVSSACSCPLSSTPPSIAVTAVTTHAPQG